MRRDTVSMISDFQPLEKNLDLLMSILKVSSVFYLWITRLARYEQNKYSSKRYTFYLILLTYFQGHLRKLAFTKKLWGGKIYKKPQILETCYGILSLTFLYKFCIFCFCIRSLFYSEIRCKIALSCMSIYMNNINIMLTCN